MTPFGSVDSSPRAGAAPPAAPSTGGASPIFARDAGEICHVCGEVATWTDHLPPLAPDGAVRCFVNVRHLRSAEMPADAKFLAYFGEEDAPMPDQLKAGERLIAGSLWYSEEWLEPPLISGAEIAMLNQARSVLKALQSRAGFKNPELSDVLADEPSGNDLGRLAGKADTAEDAIFDVLNVARSYCYVEISEEEMHPFANREERT